MRKMLSWAVLTLTLMTTTPLLRGQGIPPPKRTTTPTGSTDHQQSSD